MIWFLFLALASCRSLFCPILPSPHYSFKICIQPSRASCSLYMIFIFHAFTPLDRLFSSFVEHLPQLLHQIKSYSFLRSHFRCHILQEALLGYPILYVPVICHHNPMDSCVYLCCSIFHTAL